VGQPEDLPEAYLVNMNYSHWQTGQASAMDILALMLSIPENFCPKKDLYNHAAQCKSEYILKGVVTFSGSHYMVYLRNLKTKGAFLAETERELEKLRTEEGLPHNEWSVFDDANVKHMSGHWKNIVEDCVSSKSQPTILLYEKLTGEDIDMCDEANEK